MPFVKLDCGILNSTLWFDKMCRDIFLTALLMAEPYELEEASPQLEVCSLTETGWSVPRGWYGLVHAAGVGILHRAGVNEGDHGKAALTRLGAPEPDSRSKGFDGRRLVRIDGGYIVLNYMVYRERDYTSAKRSKRYRERKAVESRRVVTESRRDITQAEAEAEAEEKASPSLEERAKAKSLIPEDESLRAGRLVERYAELYAEKRNGARYRPRPALDWHDACELVRIWPDDRLEKLAKIVLTTDDPWISETDRSFKIFAMKASWADDRLMAWAKEQGVTV